MQNTRELPRKERRFCPSGSFSGIPAVLPCAARYGKNTVFFRLPRLFYHSRSSIFRSGFASKKHEAGEQGERRANRVVEIQFLSFGRRKTLESKAESFSNCGSHCTTLNLFYWKIHRFLLPGTGSNCRKKRNWSVNFSGANQTTVRRLRLPAVTVVCFLCSASSTDALR